MFAFVEMTDKEQDLLEAIKRIPEQRASDDWLLTGGEKKSLEEAVLFGKIAQRHGTTVECVADQLDSRNAVHDGLRLLEAGWKVRRRAGIGSDERYIYPDG